ncbi:hypothetical protein HDU81_001007, partial [Chytriomyces hyalinus]
MDATTEQMAERMCARRAGVYRRARFALVKDAAIAGCTAAMQTKIKEMAAPQGETANTLTEFDAMVRDTQRKNQGTPIIIVGDFNARHTRVGDRVLVPNNPLNGNRRTWIEKWLDDGDWHRLAPTVGKWTTNTNGGKGITDLVFVNDEALPRVSNFCVHDDSVQVASDHHLLTFEIAGIAGFIKPAFDRINIRALGEKLEAYTEELENGVGNVNQQLMAMIDRQRDRAGRLKGANAIVRKAIRRAQNRLYNATNDPRAYDPSGEAKRIACQRARSLRTNCALKPAAMDQYVAYFKTTLGSDPLGTDAPHAAAVEETDPRRPRVSIAKETAANLINEADVHTLVEWMPSGKAAGEDGIYGEL